MLLLAMSGLIIPTVISLLEVAVNPEDVLRISRSVSVVFLSVYGFFLYFSLKSHVHIIQEEGQKTPSSQIMKGTRVERYFSRHSDLVPSLLQGKGGKDTWIKDLWRILKSRT